MSFLFDASAHASAVPVRPTANGVPLFPIDADTHGKDLIARRPALLDEKLKLHARIIDEFNLTLLEKLPRAELVRQVNAYVANYVRTEKISINQKELEIFCEEI